MACVEVRRVQWTGLTSEHQHLTGPREQGQTLLGRCIASQLGARFQNRWFWTYCQVVRRSRRIIHASLFLVARCRQPSVIFVSDIDMLLLSSQE